MGRLERFDERRLIWHFIWRLEESLVKAVTLLYVNTIHSVISYPKAIELAGHVSKRSQGTSGPRGGA